MAGQQVVDWAGSDRPGVRAGAAPEMAVRMVGALLALAIAAVHVADQGGISSFATPDWIGWGYRLIEVGGVLTAVLLLIPWSAWLGWAASVLLGVGPFIGYVASRSIGVPGDHGDVGDWGYWVGTVSLVIEAALIVLGVTMLMRLPAALQAPAGRRAPGPARQAGPPRRTRQPGRRGTPRRDSPAGRPACQNLKA